MSLEVVYSPSLFLKKSPFRPFLLTGNTPLLQGDGQINNIQTGKRTWETLNKTHFTMSFVGMFSLHLSYRLRRETAMKCIYRYIFLNALFSL